MAAEPGAEALRVAFGPVGGEVEDSPPGEGGWDVMNAAASGIDLARLGAPQILDSLPDGAYITSPDRTILLWSAGAERITGWSAAEVVGRRCQDNILVHVDKDGHPLCGQEHCPLHRAIVTGQSSETPLLVFAQHRTGHRIPVEVSVSPLRDGTGQVVGGVELFRDSTVLMDDLWRARLIQQHALETRLPADPRVEVSVRYSPEEVVGGDFFHVEALDADHYGILVADVMGHGVAAALYCMQLRSLWEDLRGELMAPGKFVGELNQRLHTLAREEGYFATAVYVVLDVAGGEVRYVRAAGPRPLIVRGDGTTAWLGERNPSIGMLREVRFREAVERLGRGDTLVLFTDGAVEVEDAGGEELGEEGLRSLILAKACRDHRVDLGVLDRSLLEFSGRVRLADDLTLLAVSLTAAGGQIPVGAA